MSDFFFIFILLMVIQIIYIFKYYRYFVEAFISGKRMNLNAKYDNIAIVITGMSMFSSFFVLFNGEKENWNYLVFTIFPLLNIFMILFTIWRKNNAKKEAEDKTKNIEKEITAKQKEKIFLFLKELKRYDIIDDDSEIENKTFTLGKDTGLSLKLTHADIYYLHKLFAEKIFKTSLKAFCMSFRDKKGNLLNEKAISKGGSQQKIPKNKEKIDDIFRNIL